MDAFFEMVTKFIDVSGSGKAVTFSDLLPDTIDEYTVILIVAITLMIGILQCFLGFKSFKVWCSLIGAIIGVVVSIIFVMSLNLYESEYSELISIFFIVCLGLLGAFLAYRAYLAGVFLYAFVAVFLLFYLPLSAAINPDMLALIIAVCLGIAGGVVAVIVQRIAIITATSLSGGINIALALMLLFFNSDNIVFTMIIPLLAAVICAVGGFFVQLATTKKKPEPIQPVPVTIIPAPGVTYAQPFNIPAAQTGMPEGQPVAAPPEAPQAPAEAPQAPAEAPQAPAEAPQAPPEAPHAPPAQETPVNVNTETIEEPGAQPAADSGSPEAPSE